MKFSVFENMKFESILGKTACGVGLLLFSAYANAVLWTFNFSGRFNSSTALYNSGDTFSGSYTFETTAPVIDLTGDGDISIDSRADAIDPDLPGTGWNLTVFSSVVPGFTVSGNSGQISIGNDTSSFVVDRYIVTLFGSDPLPGGAADHFFQIDLFDMSGAGADILDSGDLDVVPNLALAMIADGRFVVPGSNIGCTDCGVTMTSLGVAAPQCDVQMSQPVYSDGETITANRLRLANASSSALAVEIKIWLEAPATPPKSLVNTGADGAFQLAAGTDFDLGPVTLLPLTATLPRGAWVFGCRMLDPVTGELLVQDLNLFDVR